MTTVRMIEIDGQRHDITGLTETYESRCDFCGEYVGPVRVAVIRVNVQTVTGQHDEFQLDAHPACLAKAVPGIAARLEALSAP